MKFWFGKKETEHTDPSKVSCDVLTLSDGAKKEAEASLFVKQETPVEPKKMMANPVFPSSVILSDVQKAAALGVSDGQQAKPVLSSLAVGVPQGAKGATVEKDTANASGGGKSESAFGKASGPSSPAALTPDAAKALLRPLGGGPALRVAVKPAGAPAVPVQSVAASVPAVPSVPVPPPAVAAAAQQAVKKVAFGLRPRGGNDEVAAETPAASAAGVPAAASSSVSGKAESVAEGLVRPKADQRALYYELMNGLYDAILILDEQGHVVDGNSRVADVLGYAREETWDLPIDKIISGMTTQMFAHLRRNLAEHHHVLIDARCTRRDGSAFAGEVGVSTLSLTRGTNMVFAIRNVERRKNAMEELKKGQAAFQIALSPAFVCDLEGHFLMVNQALLEAFGIPDEAQAKSVRFADLLPDAARFFLRASCGEKLHESLQIATPNGGRIKVELTLSPLQSGQTVTAVAGSLLQM